MEHTETGIDKISEVRKILHDLLKVIKVVTLYPADNPLPQSLRQSFAERLVDIVGDYGEIQITVEKDHLLVNEEIVFQDQSKEDRLAGIFFDSGITQFSFIPEITQDDIYTLLDCIKTYLNTPGGDRDLTVHLWESDQRAITFSTVEDVIMEEFDDSLKVQEFVESDNEQSSAKQLFGIDEVDSYDSIFDKESDDSGLINISFSEDNTATADQQAASLFNLPEEQATDLRASEAAEAMGYNDLPGVPVHPDASLIILDEISLSENETDTIQKLLRDDAEFDIYESTAEILKEMLLQEVEMNGFYETVTICEKVITELVQMGKLIDAGNLLGFLRELNDKSQKERPLWAERLKDAFITAGSRERLKVLATALNEHKSVSHGELGKFLSNFGTESIGGITELLGEFDHRHHREALCSYLVERGKGNEEILSKGMYDKRWFVVRNTVMILTQMASENAFKHLKPALKHPERRVRLELIHGLSDCKCPETLPLLREAVADSDTEIRRLAIHAILTYGGRPAFETITEIINDESFLKIDQNDQEALLVAFSRIGGDQAVGFLSELIQRRSVLPSHSMAFFRRAAFEALAHNRSEKAEKLLKKLSTAWRPEVRRQANNALKRRNRLLNTETVNG